MLETQRVQYVKLSKIIAGNNPRGYFDEAEMEELERSIAEHGIIQPLFLRPVDDGSDLFQIIAGERRYRAAKKVFGDDYQIPALCRKATDEEADQMALVENIQRANMSPTEEAEAAAKILGQCNGDKTETARLLAWTTQKLEKRLALMNCSASVRDALTKRQILLGHAELLASVPKEKQEVVVKKLLEAPELISVAQFKAGLETASKDLATGIFNKDACAGCKHSSSNQQELFAEAVAAGRCTNVTCFDAKTMETLKETETSLLEDFPVVRIVNVGENATLTPLKEVDVGAEQAKACRACANFGAAISNVPGKVGQVYKDLCFDVPCNTKKTASFIDAQKPAKEKQSKAVESTKGNTVAPKPAVNTDPKEAPTVKDSQRVIDYRITVWRKAIKKELMVNPDKNMAVLLGSLMTIGGSNIASTKLADVFTKLSGLEIKRSDVSGSAEAFETASSEVRDQMLRGVVLSITDNMEPRHLDGILNFLNVDLTRHWKLNDEYLNLLTKSEIEVVAESLGLKAAMGEKYAKATSGKKDEFIKALLNIEGFEYSGKIPSVLQYKA